MVTRFYELYANGKTVVPIKNKEKMAIMKSLTEGQKTFSELVTLLKKPKSTVSTLLDNLEADELLTSYRDKKDSRKKFYKTNSFLIASTQNTKAQKEPEEFIGSLDDPFEFMNALFRSLRSMLGSFGMDTEPMIRIMGEKVGKELSKKIQSEDKHGIITEISEFLQKHKLGRIQLVSEKPFVFVVGDCYGCGMGTSPKKTLYSFNEGIVKSIFEEKLGEHFVVQETNKDPNRKTSCKYVMLS